MSGEYEIGVTLGSVTLGKIEILRKLFDRYTEHADGMPDGPASHEIQCVLDDIEAELRALGCQRVEPLGGPGGWTVPR